MASTPPDDAEQRLAAAVQRIVRWYPDADRLYIAHPGDGHRRDDRHPLEHQRSHRHAEA